ncbi:hypothetical protein ACFPYI_06560 [Halomarina salina]|uniref:Uncharacterized protein n=1 Tax=Halomarina salina TaxID=1872699 RepID=A0ABD5RK49_9EURY|nr:hypothetical protein [Halomarina salina]
MSGLTDTLGWSLLTSGIVTIALIAMPYDSLYWGIGLLVVGILLLSRRVL